MAPEIPREIKKMIKKTGAALPKIKKVQGGKTGKEVAQAEEAAMDLRETRRPRLEILPVDQELVVQDRVAQDRVEEAAEVRKPVIWPQGVQDRVVRDLAVRVRAEEAGDPAVWDPVVLDRPVQDRVVRDPAKVEVMARAPVEIIAAPVMKFLWSLLQITEPYLPNLS